MKNLLQQTAGQHFAIHVRTPEEALEAFQSDLARRISELEYQAQHGSALEAKRLGQALAELRKLADYWQAVQIHRPRRRASSQAPA